jgi:hypothetical protein
MLFGGTVPVYCEDHTEHTDTLCGQNAKFLMLKELVHIATSVSEGVINNTMLLNDDFNDNAKVLTEWQSCRFASRR